jgi:hypothetical protein
MSQEFAQMIVDDFQAAIREYFSDRNRHPIVADEMFTEITGLLEKVASARWGYDIDGLEWVGEDLDDPTNCTRCGFLGPDVDDVEARPNQAQLSEMEKRHG